MFISHLYILFCKALVLSNHSAMGPSIFLVLIYRSYFYIQIHLPFWLCTYVDWVIDSNYLNAVQLLFPGVEIKSGIQVN